MLELSEARTHPSQAATPLIDLTEPLPPYLANYVAMLTPDDRRIYFQTARNAYTFNGTIVDLGVFLGGTTSCLIQGILANHGFSDLRLPADPGIHVFDLFKADWTAAASINFYYPHLKYVEGSDFYDLYCNRMALFMRFLKLYRGDVTTQPFVSDRRIEILGIDLCKSRSITDHVVREFFPRLQVGAHVIQQDYKTSWLPHIQTAMGYFADHFEFVECAKDRGGATVLFRLVKPIEPRDVEQFSSTCTRSKSDWLALFDRSVDALPDETVRADMIPARTFLIGEVHGIAAARDFAASQRSTLSAYNHTQIVEVLEYVEKHFL